MIATYNGTELELIKDNDGRWRWYAGQADTEVSGWSIAEACERASESFPGIEFGFAIVA